jgi:hypothetical protein
MTLASALQPVSVPQPVPAQPPPVSSPPQTPAPRSAQEAVIFDDSG